MIRRQEERYGWEFVFVAANIDAVETADRIGVRRERAANYDYTPEGTRVMYECMSKIVTECRSERPIDKDWAADLKKGKNQ